MEQPKNIVDPAAVDMGSLFDDGDGATVTLVAGDTELVAHRAVLAARSPVFRSMLYREGTGRSGASKVAVPGVEGAVLRQLLVYLYCLHAPQLPALASQLLIAADTFDLKDLKARCEQHMAARLTVETAAYTAVLAVRYSCDTLLAAALRFIKENVFGVMGTAGWHVAVSIHPEFVAELSRRLSELWTGSSEPPAVEGGATVGTRTTPDCSETPAAATIVLPVSGDNATVSQSSLATAESGPRRGDRRATPAAVVSCVAPPADAAAPRGGNVPGKPEWWELVRAVEKGTVEEVRALLAAGADVREGERSSWGALHWAASRGDAEMARCLLEAGADANARSGIRETPLHVASRAGHVAVARVLVAAAADVCARDVDGRTPVQRATLCGHGEVVTALLAMATGQSKSSFSSSSAFPRLGGSPSGMTWWIW